MERNISLVNIDLIWREHLQEMTLLREAVSWRGYGQRNPLYEYKEDAYEVFQSTISNLKTISNLRIIKIVYFIKKFIFHLIQLWQNAHFQTKADIQF